MKSESLEHIFKSSRGINRQKALAAYLFVLPTLAFFMVFRYLPMAYSLYMSLFEWNMFEAVKSYVGLQNYVSLATDAAYWSSLRITVYFVLSIAPAQIVLGMGLALLFNSKKLKLRGLFKAMYFLPVITTMVAVAIVWSWLYQPRFGLINYLLSLMGIPKQGWLMSEHLALPSVSIMTVWKDAGYNMIIFLAGLQAIPEVYYEAAQIDGAGKLHCLKNITLPLLKPAILFVMVITTIRSFQVFDQIFVMTKGGPLNSTRVLVLYLFEAGFQSYKVGYASAIGTTLLIIIFALSIVQLKSRLLRL